ncbi:MAG: hypothetical protein GX856_09880, partial [Gammaproteobacteria bacterium]|nr:hypothetical protein [Gammaproteobacteria bacterium]
TYIYDFKATPGYTVRVTSLAPESGLRGARVSVVPESSEFWAYVKTGDYEPPVVVPPNSTRPVASNLVIGETQVQVGAGEYTELTATFDVTGHASHSVVYAAQTGQPLVEVAQTVTRTATWRIDEAGEYAIVVRPFDAEGNAGDAVSTVYVTSKADTPPPVFDVFNVVEGAGGIRKYSWGYLESTMQSANLAGAEVRYTAGDIIDPDWDLMTPLGEGYYTAEFEAVEPPAGTWTFCIRARNTSGVLSTGMTRIVRTLTSNLGEVIDEIYDEIEEEIGDLTDRVDTIAAQVGDIVGAEDWDALEAYQVGDIVKFDGKLYRATLASTGQQPDTSPTYWELIGDYSSLGEAVAAAISIGNQNTSDIEAESTRLDAVYARLPGGSDGLATEAMVANEASARAAGDSANAALISGVTARMDVMGNPNLLPNPTGDTGFAGWSFVGTSGSLAQIGNEFGGRYGRMFLFGPMPASTFFDVGIMTASPYLHLLSAAGRTFTVSGDLYVYATGPAPFIELRWFNSAGVEINSGSRPRVTGSGTGWGRFKLTVTAPGTAERLMVVVRMQGTATAQRFLAARNLKLETGDIATPYSLEAPFAGQAAAMQSMEVEIDAVDNRLKAKHTVALDVNGHVSGTISENDGTTSSFSVLATVFRVISTLTGMGMEWQNGYLRIWRGAAQLIIGHTFGVNGDLVFWYGPNVGASGCSKGNGKIWFDTSGDAYFGGTLSAGILKNAAQSTQVSTTAQVSTGRFSTNGNPKVVVFSLSYLQAGRLPTNEGASTLTATVVLERSRDGSGVWTQVSSLNVNGARSFIDFEPALGYLHRWELGGSSTFTDNATGTEDFEYRARITAASGDWPRNVGGTLGTQRLAIISTEEP